jgi:membrane fusion protein, heavy metal efflux system
MSTSTHASQLARFAPIILVLALGGCAGREAGSDEPHQHGGGTALTRWTDSVELFIEYPPMIAGQRSEPWAVHVTILDGFSPVTEGVLTVRFRGTDGQVFAIRSEAPARPGIYLPSPQLPEAGSYEVAMELDGSRIREQIYVGRIQVYAAEDDIPPTDDHTHGEIALLKEEQWAIDFAVARVETLSVAASVPVSGEIIPASGRVAQVSAPVSGLLLAQGNVTAPAPGTWVRQGQTLAVLSPFGGDNSYARARAEVERLQREVERAERLFAAEAIPERRLIEARHDLEVASAALDAIGGGRGSGYNYSVRAPISGQVNERFAAPGSRVEAGDLLYTLVHPGVVWLLLRVPARHAALATELREVVFTVEGSQQRFRSTQIVSTGAMLERETRSLPVTMAVPNPEGRLRIGMFVEGTMRMGTTAEGLAIPNEAIQLEDGQPVVYVQVGGETFERRPFIAGASDGTHTIVAGGVRRGEHVVTRGAYHVYLASLGSTEIGDHGHPH